MDSDGFTFVKRGKKKGGAAYHAETTQELLKLKLEHIRSEENSFIEKSKRGKNTRDVTLEQKVDIFNDSYNKYKIIVEESEIAQDAKDKLNKSNSFVSTTLIDTICYGIGNFFTSKKSLCQLILAQILHNSISNRGELLIYDPIFTELEKHIATTLGFTLIDQNEEGKRQVTKPTIFYMPHCGKCLYNNVLCSNWSLNKLSNIILIGNSFHSYTKRLSQNENTGIEKILPFSEEVELKTSKFEIPDAFNDTSIHTFPSRKLEEANQEFWQSAPTYVSDVELIPAHLLS